MLTSAQNSRSFSTAISTSVPGVRHISGAVWKDVTVQNDLHTYTWTVNGVRPDYQDIMKLDTSEGRFFNGAEDEERAHVCLIASEAKTKLFSNGWALGETAHEVGIPFGHSPSSASSPPRCRRASRTTSTARSTSRSAP